MADDRDFHDWMQSLNEDVIQGEYGYEEGEFTAYPELWRPLFMDGLTPSQAFKKALDDLAEKRREEDEAARQNWERIRLDRPHPSPTETQP